MESPFGAYRGGYNAMPSGYMEAATQVGKNYGQAIQSLGGIASAGIDKFYKSLEDKKRGQQSAPTMVSQYQQVAEATGQQVDPTILERYQNIGQMSGPQIQQFNQDVAAAQQQAIALANIQRQQQAFQMQQQAAQRAMQQQALQQERNAVLGSWGLGLPSNSSPASNALFPQ